VKDDVVLAVAASSVFFSSAAFSDVVAEVVAAGSVFFSSVLAVGAETADGAFSVAAGFSATVSLLSLVAVVVVVVAGRSSSS